MTKAHAPLSIELAMWRIADQLDGGWSAIAEIACRSEATVRKWGNDAQPEDITLRAAIALDIAYRRSGGEGRPLFQTYALQLEVEQEQAFAAEVELTRRACTLIRETGEANEAVVLATLPDSGERGRMNAIGQLEDVINEATATIAALRAGIQARPPPDSG